MVELVRWCFGSWRPLEIFEVELTSVGFYGLLAVARPVSRRFSLPWRGMHPD